MALPLRRRLYQQLDISTYCNPQNTRFRLTRPRLRFGKYGTSYLYRTEIALLGTKYGSLVAYDNTHTPHENAEVNVLMDGNGSWHGGVFVSQKRYNELMGDGHVVNQNIAQFGQTWSLQLTFPPQGP